MCCVLLKQVSSCTPNNLSQLILHRLNHNSLSGDHCEKCSDGWYGNATDGTPEDCSPCPCPGGPYASNQFANTCYLDADGLPTCVNCSLGYSNRSCDRCSVGYFGRPRVSFCDWDTVNYYVSCVFLPVTHRGRLNRHCHVIFRHVAEANYSKSHFL